MRSIPVDVARLGALLCVMAPEPRMNQETGQQRVDREGVPVFVVGVSVRQRDRRQTDVIDVAVSGEPVGIVEGMRVIIADLVAASWEIDGRKGMSYRASSVLPAVGPAPVAMAPARGKGQGGEG